MRGCLLRLAGDRKGKDMKVHKEISTSEVCSRSGEWRRYGTDWWWASSECSWCHAECRNCPPLSPPPLWFCWMGPEARKQLRGTQCACCVSTTEPTLTLTVSHLKEIKLHYDQRKAFTTKLRPRLWCVSQRSNFGKDNNYFTWSYSKLINWRQLGFLYFLKMFHLLFKRVLQF